MHHVSCLLNTRQLWGEHNLWVPQKNYIGCIPRKDQVIAILIILAHWLQQGYQLHFVRREEIEMSEKALKCQNTLKIHKVQNLDYQEEENRTHETKRSKQTSPVRLLHQTNDFNTSSLTPLCKWAVKAWTCNTCYEVSNSQAAACRSAVKPRNSDRHCDLTNSESLRISQDGNEMPFFVLLLLLKWWLQNYKVWHK